MDLQAITNPVVSVIIPTYHDWKRLSLCLKALEQQSFPSSQFEIFVVNNDPSDIIPDSFPIPSNCEFLNEGKAGSYAARNAALKIARGNIIAFTDSDCIPDKDWLANAILFFENNKQYSRIAGNIELFYKGKILTSAELYEKRYSFKQDFAASKGIGITGNMLTYRKVFDSVGNFNDELLSGGDNEWSLRAQKANFKISFAEDVIIYHPARHKMSELTKKSKRVAGNIENNKLKAIQRFVKYLIPPLNALIPKYGLTVTQSVQVFFIRYYLNLSRSIEELNISFGKKANRE